VIYQGGCHCGAVRFEIEASEDLEVDDCNCSICRRSGFLHLILPLSRFRLVSGADQLSTYTFNTGVARHTFCSICGIKPFYTPRTNPDGIDVNAHCLDTAPRSMTVTPFNGLNWEQHGDALAHRSR
jgi:hypothetical protein